MENQKQEIQKNFYNYFHKTVKPILLKLENNRKNKVLIYRIISCLIFLAAIAGGIYLYKIITSIICSFIVLLFAIVIIYMIRCSFKKQFEKEIKPLIMENLMKAFGDFHWTNKPLIQSNELYKAKIFGKYTKRIDDDNFYGKYNGTDIIINEMTLYEYKDVDAKYRNTYSEGEKLLDPSYYVKSEMKKQNILTFTGIVIKIKSNKNFTGETYIGKKELINPNKYGLEEVSLEDVEFNKIFNTYTTDQTDARYILSPSFMERLKELSKEFKPKSAFAFQTVSCAFYDNTMLLAISSGAKDMFSLGDLFKPLNSTEQYQTMCNELLSILSAIDKLKPEVIKT